MTARYYLIGSIEGSRGTLARVMNHEYRYLDLATGAWVFDATVTDRVHFEASTKDVTEAGAMKWAAKHVPGLSPVWI